MINVPPCCHTKPFGFIEIKIDERITRIPLCVKHYDTLPGEGSISIEIYRLEAVEEMTTLST